ncbi:hypothetical protein Tco_0130256, partial [Tanacetum coccineum]
MYKDTLKDSGAGADKSIEELQVEVELQRDREPRTRTKPLRFRDESNTLQQSPLSPANCQAFPQRHVAGEKVSPATCRWGSFVRDYFPSDNPQRR